MGRLNTWNCDECGAIKKETNGWWIVGMRPGYRNDEAAILISAMPDGEFDLHAGDLTLCCRACVQRKVAEFLGGPSLG